MSDDRQTVRGPMPNDDEALDWAIRMAEPDADWDGFTAWLEADPEHAAHYDRIASALLYAEAAVGAVPAAMPVAPVADPRPLPRPVGRRRAPWIGAALAAALVGSIGVGLWSERAQPYVIETVAGEQRTVALGDGSSIVLAGASRVSLDRAAPRMAVVDRGKMLFRVRHDAHAPFRVQVGDLALTDLGTVFDVTRSAGRTRVAVAEGAVLVDPDGAALRLDPGQAVVSNGRTLERETTDIADVGGWREGRLAFDDATLADVAEDLSRHLAVTVRANPAVARRTFRGTLDTRRLKNDPALLGTLLGVRVRQDTGGWTLE